MLISFPVVFLSLTDDFTATPVCLHRSEKCNSNHIIPLLLESWHFWDSETFSTPSTKEQVLLLDTSVSRVECTKKKMETETEMSRWGGFGQSWERIQARSMDRGISWMSLKPHVSVHSHCWGVRQQDAGSLKSVWGGIVLLLIALWPPGKGQEINKNFLRGSLKKWECFFFIRSRSRMRSWSYICGTTGCINGWRGEVESRSRSSLFLQSPLIPCYPQHSSLICNPGEGKEYLSHLPNSLNLPPSAPQGNFFVVALARGHVVL